MAEIMLTGQVARAMKLAHKTVTKMFDSGQLKGYRIPGSRDRRYLRSSVEKVMEEHGMPLEWIDNQD